MIEPHPKTCDLHNFYDEARKERWAEQYRKNDVLFGTCKELSVAVNALNNRIAYATGAIAVVIVAAPFLWKLLSIILGVKL